MARARLTLETTRAEARRLDPARLWTTIATGQPASVHGVRTLETQAGRRPAGCLAGCEGSSFARLMGASTDLLRLTRPSIASGSDRREKTFWEVATEAGLRTVVVNWWATWPAASGHGVVLTDSGDAAPRARRSSRRGNRTRRHLRASRAAMAGVA